MELLDCMVRAGLLLPETMGQTLSNIFRIQNIILVGDGGSIEIETKRGGGEVSMMGGI